MVSRGLWVAEVAGSIPAWDRLFLLFFFLSFLACKVTAQEGPHRCDRTEFEVNTILLLGTDSPAWKKASSRTASDTLLRTPLI